MNTYALLLRGINVGGKNKLPMAGLKAFLEELGCSRVATYIASGNAVLACDQPAEQVQALIEAGLPGRFPLDSELVKALVLRREQLQAVVERRPAGFGEQPETYHYDAIFLMGIDAAEAMRVFDPRPGVDRVWAGEGVIYSERLSAQRSRSRLTKIIGTPAYQSMTIRNWNTTTRLLEMLLALDPGEG